ncbi:MAG TPA: inorganic phosphate transporter [Elusimicrobiota bacterium]|nr:inorganic phosphate transporter [Elusimicrobiota bacterium]
MELNSAFFLAAAVVILAVTFNFTNGFHDAANVVATLISTRAFEPETALVMAAIAEFIGPFLFGTAVAATIGKGIVDPTAVTALVALVGLSAAIIWNLATWYFGLPSSSSHALVGGLVGGVVAASGFSHLNYHGLITIVIVLITSPLLGLVAGYIFQKILTYLSRGLTPKAGEIYKKSQLFSGLGLALSHGANDAQKAMGIIVMTLLSQGYLTTFHVPFWVMFLCAIPMGLGTMFGGWRIIKTVGNKIFKLRPINGFSAQMSSAAVIMGAAILGGPVSTTHVVSSSIAGVGCAERIKAVRWETAGNILAAWVITIPASALVSAVMYWCIQVIIKIVTGGN